MCHHAWLRLHVSAVSASVETPPIRTPSSAVACVYPLCGSADSSEIQAAWGMAPNPGTASARVKHSTVNSKVTSPQRQPFPGLVKAGRHLVCVNLISREGNNGARWAPAAGGNRGEQVLSHAAADGKPRGTGALTCCCRWEPRGTGALTCGCRWAQGMT